MFLQADLSLHFDGPQSPKRVSPPSLFGKALHVLSLGLAGEKWDEEPFDGTTMLVTFAEAFAEAGLTDVVSVSVDERIEYRDERRREDDLEPVLRELAGAAQLEPLLLELVAQASDAFGTYLAQITVERIHPPERAPLRIRVYAVLAGLDLERAGSGYRSANGSTWQRAEQAIASLVGSAEGVEPLLRGLEDGVRGFLERIRSAVHARVPTAPSEPLILACAVRARDRLEPEALPRNRGGEVIPILRDYPGLDSATYYLRVWLSVLTQLEAEIRKTLIVDESGRPAWYVAEEAAKLGQTKAYVPGEDVSQAPGALDVTYFGGHDYVQSLIEGGRMTADEGLVGAQAWEKIRKRELGVRETMGRARGPRYSSYSSTGVVNVQTGHSVGW